MSFEQKDMSASLFRNDKKTTDKHPGWKGHAKIDGVEYWVSGWVNLTKTGDKWLSLAFERKDEDTQQSGADSGSFDDDIPF